MKDLSPPKIEPINVKQYEFKQSHTRRQINYLLEALLSALHRVEKVFLFKT
jgi:hypothetical protein